MTIKEIFTPYEKYNHADELEVDMTGYSLWGQRTSPNGDKTGGQGAFST